MSIYERLNEDEVYVKNGYVYYTTQKRTNHIWINMNNNMSHRWEFGYLDCVSGKSAKVTINNKQYTILLDFYVENNRLQFLEEFPIKNIYHHDSWYNDRILHISKYRNISSCVINQLYASRTMFEIEQWHDLPNAIKVRLIIFASNFPNIIQQNVENIKTITRIENSNGSKIIASLLIMLLMSVESDPEIKKQYFTNSHRRLVEAITDAFASQYDISGTLASFLPLCNASDGSRKEMCKAWPIRNNPNISHLPDNEKTVRCEFCGYYLYCQINGNPMSHKALNSYHLEMSKSDYIKQDLRNLIHASGADDYTFSEVAERGFESIDSYAYVIASYISRLNEIFVYLKCRKCGGVMHPDYRYTKSSNNYAFTVFSCKKSESDNDHDKGIYINHCFHYGKHRRTGPLSFESNYHRDVIDSRECKHTESDITHIESNHKVYLCMVCGGGISRIKPMQYCPSCLRADRFDKTKSIIKCTNCGHDGSVYGYGPIWSNEKVENNEVSLKLYPKLRYEDGSTDHSNMPFF